MNTRTLTSKAEILRVLEADRLYAAYAVGDLADHLFPHCRWAVAETGDGPIALALTYTGLATPAIFVMGESAGIGEILHRLVRLPQANVTFRSEHMAAVSAFYRVSGERRMWRMVVDATSFRPATATTVRLGVSDLRRLNTLYAWGGGNFFEPQMLEQGVFYAVEVDGALVAAAGTHLVSPQYGVADVGNVYTHPDHRNRGHATACTSAVVRDLLNLGCATVVLNVRQGNEPAVRAYTKLGFSIHCPFIESPARRWSGVRQVLHRLIT